MAFSGIINITSVHAYFHRTICISIRNTKFALSDSSHIVVNITGMYRYAPPEALCYVYVHNRS